jgi:hypothetical protein
LQLSTTSAETLDDLLPLCKSKYLLCNTNNQFCRIEQELVKGRKVLYCSSPCQIKALKLYLRKEYHNLILVDFVCHGVGAQSLFDKSVDYVEEKIKGKMKSFMFRYKKSNASSHYYYYYDYLKSNKLLHKSGIYMQFPYYYAYQKYIIYRDSCYKCQYASEYRQGDITIADFHTIDKYVKGVDRFAGTSMFVCNTEKGLALFNLLSEQLKVFELPWEEVKKNNRFGGEEEKKRQLRFDFLKSLKEDAFSTTVRKYLDYRKDWRYYYYMLPKFIQKIGCKLFLRG